MFESTALPPRFKARLPFKIPSFSFRGGGLFSLAFKILLIISPLLFLRACLITYVAPDQIGMRQISFGPNKGLQKVLVRAGYRRQIAGYEKIQTFPRNIQLVEFTNDESERGADHISEATTHDASERRRCPRRASAGAPSPKRAGAPPTCARPPGSARAGARGRSAAG